MRRLRRRCERGKKIAKKIGSAMPAPTQLSYLLHLRRSRASSFADAGADAAGIAECDAGRPFRRCRLHRGCAAPMPWLPISDRRCASPMLAPRNAKMAPRIADRDALAPSAMPAPFAKNGCVADALRNSIGAGIRVRSGIADAAAASPLGDARRCFWPIIGKNRRRAAPSVMRITLFFPCIADGDARRRIRRCTALPAMHGPVGDAEHFFITAPRIAETLFSSAPQGFPGIAEKCDARRRGRCAARNGDAWRRFQRCAAPSAMRGATFDDAWRQSQLS
jgi:hypothetical protein